MALEIGGKIFKLTSMDVYNLGTTIAAVAHARWVSAPLLRRLAEQDQNWVTPVVAGHSSCTPQIAEFILGRPLKGTGEDAGRIYLAVADNPALLDELRRRGLAQVLRSNFDVPRQDRYRAFLHPLCTDDIRLMAENDVIAWGARYVGNAGPEFWQQVFQRLDAKQKQIALEGPGCPPYIRAMWQLAK